MNFTLSFLLRSDKLVIGQHLLLSPVSTAVKPAFSEFDHCPNPIQEGELCVCWCCWSRGVVCALRSCSWCAVQALSRHQSPSFVPFPPHFLRVSGALFNSSSFSARSSSRSRSLIRFLACCSQCRNPSCSRKCKSVSFFDIFINVECCRVCPWTTLRSSRRDTRCTSCQRCCEYFQLLSECQM